MERGEKSVKCGVHKIATQRERERERCGVDRYARHVERRGKQLVGGGVPTCSERLKKDIHNAINQIHTVFV